MGSLRLLVAEDHEIVRKVCVHSEYNLVGHVPAKQTHGREAVEKRENLRPDVTVRTGGCLP